RATAEQQSSGPEASHEDRDDRRRRRRREAEDEPQLAHPGDLVDERGQPGPEEQQRNPRGTHRESLAGSVFAKNGRPGEGLPRVTPLRCLAGLALLWIVTSDRAMVAQDFRLARFARFDVGFGEKRIEPAVAQAAVPENKVTGPRPKRFWAAAGELALLEVL